MLDIIVMACVILMKLNDAYIPDFRPIKRKNNISGMSNLHYFGTFLFINYQYRAQT